MKPAPVHEEDFTIAVLGRRLAASWLRPAGGHDPNHPVLVFLHEGLGSIPMWGDFPRELAAACNLPALLYDRPGHGLSDPLVTGGLDLHYIDFEAWEVLPRVLEVCHVRRAVLIGHSDGGTMALMYAARHPGPALGIITEAAHVFVEEVTREGIRQALTAYRTGDLKARLQKYHGPGLDALFRRWTDTWLSDLFAAWNVEALLDKVHCPVLAIQGEADEYGTTAQVASIVEKAGGRSEAFIVPACRHVPHHQARGPVLERIVGFIRRLKEPGGL